MSTSGNQQATGEAVDNPVFSEPPVAPDEEPGQPQLGQGEQEEEDVVQKEEQSVVPPARVRLLGYAAAAGLFVMCVVWTVVANQSLVLAVR